MRWPWQNWQNLNDPNQNWEKRYWLHGRTWFGDWSFEWLLPHWAPMVSVAFRMPERWLAKVHVGGGPVALYISNQRRHELGGIRRFDLYWFEGTLNLYLWAREFESRSTDPWWVRGLHFTPMDFVFGRLKHEHVVHEDWKETLIPMPEGCYPAKIRKEERTWTRPRWPWRPLTTNQKYVAIELPGGVPFEGKGENSWDCGEDGLWGCSSSGWDYEKAVGHVVETVLKNRKRYGGSWTHRDLGIHIAPRREKANS